MKKEFICDNCGKVTIKIRTKDVMTNNHFCDKNCFFEYLKKNAHKTKCLYCDKETTNSKFCSQGCATTFHNKLKPKRKKKDFYCIACGKIVSYRKKYCAECNPQFVNWDKITLNDIIYTADKQMSNKYTRVRDHAKTVFKNSNLPKACFCCNYEKHFEVCHIKPIYMFAEDTTISVINNLSNLVALCPNCHWELDNGLINIDDIRSGSPG